ncbi:MAG: N4-gp56 family major capsid protein [Lachnospiraceae bacterium]|nr:N4-gp56 family major capsid protein [Lachnospiraceae bacterium]
MMKELMNLQLFANHVNVTTDTMTSGQTYPTYNSLSAEMKTFYDMTLIDEATAQLVHDQFGQKRPIPANGGKTIEFRKFSSLPKATTALTEGVTPDGKRLDVTAITATVSQYGDYITQSDVLELTALDNTILEATKLLGKQAGSTLDTIVRNVLVAGTNVTYCPTVANGTETAVTSRANLNTTSKLTVKTIQKVVAKLRGQNAPTFNGKYVAIIHPYVAYDLMRDPEWIDAHKYANPTNLYEGEIGEIAGVRFVQTTEAKVWNDNTCPKIGSDGTTYHSVFATLIMGEGAYGVTEITGGGLQTIVKQKGSAGTADPLDQRSSVGWKAIKTAELLVPNYLVRVESCSPDFDSTAAN